ncbi:MAG: hypothetical protein M3209_13765 [Acidobacteriota bacterium]|nr:hypothetical protein [Acidobacteriota bacterium]
MSIRDNKFARQAGNLAKKNSGHEEDISIDQKLALLEEDIRRLKIEFDIFFNGGAKRAPYDTKNRVETMIKRLSDERQITFAQRYLFNSIMARYTAFKELWRRTMQGREEGGAGSRAAAAMRSMQSQEDRKSNLDSFVCSDVEREVETTRKIYDALVQAKQKCDKSTDDLSFSSFQRQLATQIARFRQNNECKQIQFEVGVDNDRVVFKARAAKDK